MSLVAREHTVLDLEKVDFDKGGGFVTVVTQDSRSGALLMVARTNREALDKTLSTGEMHYHSRTRGLWRKGGTSGNVQKVQSLTLDCDGDAILARVIPAGPTCHTGARSCFGEAAFRADALSELDAVIAGRATSQRMENSYTQRLLSDRNLRMKKLGEEVAELVTACADGDGKRAQEEAADVVYHLLVALRALKVTLEDVRNTLALRAGEGASS